jgi:hypothetical protein
MRLAFSQCEPATDEDSQPKQPNRKWAAVARAPLNCGGKGGTRTLDPGIMSAVL